MGREQVVSFERNVRRTANIYFFNLGEGKNESEREKKKKQELKLSPRELKS